MKDLLKRQIEFEFWANTELLKNLKLAKPLHPRALLLFSHILSANIIWLNRLKNEAVTTNLFQERTIEECEVLLIDLKNNWEKYFQMTHNEGLTKKIEFISPVDQTKRSIASGEAIMHIVHHSSYHRGQIITLLKGSIEQLPLITYMPFASKKIE